jgi:hypothetical protein
MFEQVTFEHNVSYNPNHNQMLLDLHYVLNHLMVQIVFDMINKFVEKMILKNLHMIVHMMDVEYHHMLFLKYIILFFAKKNKNILFKYLLFHYTFFRENKSEMIHLFENLVAFLQPNLREKEKFDI